MQSFIFLIVAPPQILVMAPGATIRDYTITSVNNLTVKNVVKIRYSRTNVGTFFEKSTQSVFVQLCRQEKPLLVDTRSYVTLHIITLGRLSTETF